MFQHNDKLTEVLLQVQESDGTHRLGPAGLLSIW